MGGFLNGLLGALKGATSGGGDTGAGGVKGLLGGLGASLPSGAPGAVEGDPGSDLGDFRLTPSRGGLMVQAATAANQYAPVTPEAPVKKPGFMTRINTPDEATGFSTVDKWDRFGSTLMDIGDGGDRAAKVEAAAAGRAGQYKNKLLMAQIDEMFADDPRMRFLLKANPEKATAAMADVYKSANETRVVGKGSSVGDGEGVKWMAPEYGQADGYGYKIDGEGFNWGDQRGQTHQETETGRHNLETERLGEGNLGVAQGNLGVSQGHLGVARQRLDFDRFKEDRDFGGRSMGGASAGLEGMSTADLVAALRGGR